jgi:hypothetical protein
MFLPRGIILLLLLCVLLSTKYIFHGIKTGISLYKLGKTCSVVILPEIPVHYQE